MMQNLLDDPNDVGMMSLGLRLLSTPGKFGQALGTAGLGAMGDMQQQKQAQAMARQRAMQEQMQMMQLDQIKRQQAEQERLRQRQMGVENAYRGAMETPAQQALAQGGGPTVGNAQAMQGMSPRINQQKLIASLMAEDPIMAAQMMTPKPEETKVVGDALVGIGAGGVKELYRAPAKPKEVNYNDLVIMGPDGKPMLNQLALDAKRAVAGAGATRINVPVSLSTEKKYGEQFAGEVAKSDMALMDAGRRAPELADRANRVKQVIQSGNAITGFGADWRLGATKALAVMGIQSAGNAAADTETLATTLASNTLDQIKASGLGAGNGFSNADRDFLEKAVGGKITLEAATINRLSDLAVKSAELSAKKWNERARSIPRSAVDGTGIDVNPVRLPQIGDGQNAPSVGQVVDGYRFKGGNPGVKSNWEKL